MQNASDKFIADLLQLQNASFPARCAEQACKCMLDYLGNAIAGAKSLRFQTGNILDHLHEDKGNTPVIGSSHRCSPAIAALLNGTHAHTTELDDGDRVGMMHPGAPIFSALFPLAYLTDTTQEHFLKCAVIGYEAALRIAAAVQPALKERGYHATGVCGAIGAAIAVSAFRNDDADTMKAALSSAATMASGRLLAIRDDATLKPVNAGWAAHTGFMAATFAKAGLCGPSDPLCGKNGLLAMLSDNPALSKLDQLEGGIWRIERIYQKPFAACRHAHAPIDATLSLREQHYTEHKNIESIIVKTYRWAVDGHDHQQAHTCSSARMSTPYAVASAWIEGHAGLSLFEPPNLDRHDIQALARKVEVTEDPILTSMVPGKRPAQVELRLASGRTYACHVDLTKGEPEKPLTWKDTQNKFKGLAEYAGLCEHDINVILQLLQVSGETWTPFLQQLIRIPESSMN